MKEFLLTEDVLISNQYHGQRIDVVLAQLFPDFSRSQLSLWLKEGAITVDEKAYKPKEKVHGGERIKLHVDLKEQEIEAQAEPIPLNIVFEDECLLVVNKPAGLVVHPGAGNPCHTLVNGLLHHSSDLHHLPRAGIVHRLDKDTTGLLLVAKTLTAHTNLVRQMQAREVQRHYQALTYGHIIAGGHLDTFYGRHPRNRLKMAVCKQGKQAITHFSIQKQYHYFTLLDVTLMTGRTHQIRVHMDHINHPVVGDPLYGGQSRLPAGVTDSVRVAVKQFKRQALHACKLSFMHPESQESLTFTAELPDDFSELLKTLDTNLV
jgi:23S rRNA pseudouridine1911/1915/1917 synthase